MTDTTPPKIRQRFNVVVGWIGVVIGLFLFASTITGVHSARTPFVGLTIACLSYCVLARPWIAAGDRVIISNVLREVTLPWAGISHATSRGSLTINDNDGVKTTVWAIGSQRARVDRADASDMDVRARINLRPDPNDLRAPLKSAAALREAIDAEVIDNPSGPSGRTVRWLPLPCALMAFAGLSLVVGFLR